ncbi:hypothetical protein [Kitasatospora sp. NPDC004289]
MNRHLPSSAATARALGVLLVLGVDAALTTVPAAWLTLLPFTLPFAWFAAPPAPGLVPTGSSWQAQLSRRRTTAFATGCTVTAALGDPPLWLAAALTLLLLGYLLHLDGADPDAADDARRPGRAVAASFGSAVLVLLAAAAPLGSSAPGPLVAVLAVAGAAAACALALRGSPADRDDEGPRPE